jgi:guanylate kinase
MTRARLTVLAGPTAVGKGSVTRELARRYPQVWVSVSVTTRAPRPGETDGVDYCFVDDAEFDRLIADGELLEWALVHSLHRSGTPRRPVEQMLANGRPTLLEIDLQGARQVRAVMPTAQFVFLAPPSWEELVRRLVGRGTETQEQRDQRLRTARIELAAEDEFDVTVVNDDLERAADALVALILIPPS